MASVLLVYLCNGCATQLVIPILCFFQFFVGVHHMIRSGIYSKAEVEYLRALLCEKFPEEVYYDQIIILTDMFSVNSLQTYMNHYICCS